jgi:hypothetical protein
MDYYMSISSPKRGGCIHSTHFRHKSIISKEDSSDSDQLTQKYLNFQILIIAHQNEVLILRNSSMYIPWYSPSVYLSYYGLFVDVSR